ncbi:hypothetical protein ES703_50466 [subsurface metagenome]
MGNENQDERIKWLEEIFLEDKFVLGFTNLIMKGLAEKEKLKQPEKSDEEIKKEIKNKSLGDLVLEMSK